VILSGSYFDLKLVILTVPRFGIEHHYSEETPSLSSPFMELSAENAKAVWMHIKFHRKINTFKEPRVLMA
jgi:hypothetical protein